MSIAVELEELRAKIAEFPGAPFLLTVSDDLRAHSVAVTPEWDGDELVVPAGRTSLANAQVRPLVALLWPAAPGEFSLIVDGEATRCEDGQIAIRPTRAVLHRPAPADPGSDSGSGTGNDCRPVGSPPPAV